MTRKLDRLNSSNYQGAAFRRLWQKNCETVEANDADLQTQIDNINLLLQAKADAENTDILTPVEKKLWVKEYADILAQQTDIDAKATTYGITTEKTNYDTAVSALTTYLGTLTTAVAWNVLTDNTTIVRTTFNSKFNDVELKKRLLLNKIHDAAKVLADAADAAADAAQADADAAIIDAAAAQADADTAEAKAVAASREAARLSSYTVPTIVLTATDAGSDATISIAAHTRVYPVQGTYDVPDVSISAGSITGRAFSTKYWVYYNDTTLAATSPTFLSTTTQLTAQVGSAAGRHLVGVITTPADGGGGTGGSGGLPPGGGGGDGTAIP